MKKTLAGIALALALALTGCGGEVNNTPFEDAMCESIGQPDGCNLADSNCRSPWESRHANETGGPCTEWLKLSAEDKRRVVADGLGWKMTFERPSGGDNEVADDPAPVAPPPLPPVEKTYTCVGSGGSYFDDTHWTIYEEGLTAGEAASLRAEAAMNDGSVTCR